MSDVPLTMKGLLVTSFGAPSDAVTLKTDMKAPVLDEESDDILVRVKYASLHLGDYKISNGDMGKLAGLMGFKLPYVPGQDYSGKVIKVGKKVTEFAVGDSVCGQVRLGNGTLCEYIVVNQTKEKEIYKMPSNVNFVSAAGIQCSLETAYQSLHAYGGGMRDGDSVLVLGGSTVAGMYATQMAKNVFNSKRIAVTSSSEALCKSLGADTVINYKEKQWESELKDANFDIIFDVMGGPKSWPNCNANSVLSKQGKFITLCGDMDADAKVECCLLCSVMCAAMCRQCASCCCGEREYYMVNQQRSKDMEQCLQLITKNQVKAMTDPDAPFALENFLAAYDKLSKRNAHGKLIIALCDDDEENAQGNDVLQQNQNNVQEEDEEEVQEQEQLLN